MTTTYQVYVQKKNKRKTNVLNKADNYPELFVDIILLFLSPGRCCVVNIVHTYWVVYLLLPFSLMPPVHMTELRIT